MSNKRDWFKWKQLAGRRGTLRRAAARSGNGFETMGAAIALLDHARIASHHIDNPEGAFTTSIEDLAIDYSVGQERVREAIGALVATGWVKCSPDVAAAEAEAELSLKVVKFLKYNHAQGAPAERTSISRENRNSALLQGSVTPRNEPLEMSLEREGEREETNTSKQAEPATDNARILFDIWTAKTGRNPNANKLTPKRKKLVAARLRDGYTMSQLTEAIHGIAGSDWHSGLNPNQTRYDTFDFIFRSGENIEKGVEFASEQSNRTAASTLSLVTIDSSILVSIERNLGRDLTGDEEALLLAGSISPQAFLAQQGAA